MIDGKRERERGRKRSRDYDYDMTGSPRKRTRSMSSYSSNSVSTISTNLSRGSRVSPNSEHDNYYTSQINDYAIPPPAPEPFRGQKRRRSFTDSSSSSSSGSYASDGPRGQSFERSSGRERMTRRKRKSHSPAQRGRRRSRSSTFAERDSRRSRSRSLSRDLRHRAKMRSPSPERTRDSRRKRRSPSPGWSDRKRPVPSGSRRERNDAYSRHAVKRDEGPHRLNDRSQLGGSPDRSHRYRDRREDYVSSRTKNGTSYVRQERSMSPYSKRLALTQAMNRGVA